MPSSTERQKRYVYYLRDKYKDKASTPKKYQWVWNDEWLTVKKEQRQQLTIWKSIYREDVIVDQTKTPEFKKWFGYSKIKKGGKPLVVYHGTNKKFSEFDNTIIGKNSGNYGHYGYGLYFSFHRGEASTYGKYILPVYLRVENPLYADNPKNLERYAKEFGDYEKIDIAIDRNWLLKELRKKDRVAYELALLLTKYSYEKAWELFLENNKIDDSKLDLNDVSEWVEKTDIKNKEGLSNYIINDIKRNLGSNPIIIQDYYFAQTPDLKWMTDLGNRSKELTDRIRKDGYDGIISGSEIVVFNSNQIKSAIDNNGEFNRNSNNIYESKYNENVIIPLNKGDVFAAGKFKNKKYIYDSHYINDKGDIIIITSTGKEVPMCKIRLIKENEEFNENIKRFSESLRFSDLMKMSSLSPFTRDYNKETNKLMGNPTNHTKLKAMKVNRKKDYITFVWKTRRTPKYGKNQKMKAVDPNNMELKPAKFYTIEFRILDFFKWLNTSPNDITNKDVEDVLKVADVQVWDSTPMWQFQGGNYNMSLFGASIHSETRPPKYWNTVVSKFGKVHDENQFLSKHSAGVVNSIKFYIPMMRQMVKSYMIKNNMLKGKSK